jgi:hypothetical protein
MEAKPVPDYNSNSDDNAMPFVGGHQGLMIASTPQGRFFYWKGFEPSELHTNDESHLVACLEELPYQVGRPLTPIAEEGIGDTELVTYSSGIYSPECHVNIATITDAPRGQYDDKLLEDISAEEMMRTSPRWICTSHAISQVTSRHQLELCV